MLSQFKRHIQPIVALTLTLSLVAYGGGNNTANQNDSDSAARIGKPNLVSMELSEQQAGVFLLKWNAGASGGLADYFIISQRLKSTHLFDLKEKS